MYLFEPVAYTSGQECSIVVRFDCVCGSKSVFPRNSEFDKGIQSLWTQLQEEGRTAES